MSKEEKVNKILEMTKEIVQLQIDEISDRELDKLYAQTKFTLETLKELRGDSNE